ncbi:MAG: MATE family efflux transporter, partial [Rhizobiaceae bacterium]|nr:MATE family efflux transporter [Rhizobiaceae bacterium]
LPLMGLGLAFQTICGNNFGAGERQRVAGSLAIAVVSAFFYCVAVEVLVVLAAAPIGRTFSADPLVAAEFVRIIPWMLAVYVLFGPVMMLGAYFQAIGDAGRAALFGLARPYLLSVPLTFLLPFFFGEAGIWRVSLFAETGMVALAALVITHGRRRGLAYGLLPA